MTQRSSPAARYSQHKSQAKQRGIHFALTFEQWWALWLPFWHKRGRGSFDMCMCRHHDNGDYVIGNVRIATNRENKHEHAMEAKVRRTARGRTYVPREHHGSAGQATQWISRGDVNNSLGAKEGA